MLYRTMKTAKNTVKKIITDLKRKIQNIVAQTVFCVILLLDET